MLVIYKIVIVRCNRSTSETSSQMRIENDTKVRVRVLQLKQHTINNTCKSTPIAGAQVSMVRKDKQGAWHTPSTFDSIRRFNLRARYMGTRDQANDS